MPENKEKVKDLVEEVAKEKGLDDLPPEVMERIERAASTELDKVGGGMDTRAKIGFMVLGAGAFYVISKARGYSYVRPNDLVGGYCPPDENGTTTTTEQKILFSRIIR